MSVVDYPEGPPEKLYVLVCFDRGDDSRQVPAERDVAHESEHLAAMQIELIDNQRSTRGLVARGYAVVEYVPARTVVGVDLGSPAGDTTSVVTMSVEADGTMFAKPGCDDLGVVDTFAPDKIIGTTHEGPNGRRVQLTGPSDIAHPEMEPPPVTKKATPTGRK